MRKPEEPAAPYASDAAETDVVTDYLASAAHHRQRGLRRAAAVLGIGAIAAIALGTRMSDIGHAVGFFALGGALLVASVVVLYSARSRP